jgi:hypothetical protein
VENVLSGKDYILDAALQTILRPDGAGLIPTGAPVVTAPADTVAFIQNGNANLLEDLAKEHYSNPTHPGKTYSYTIALKASQPLLWGYFWCAKDKTVLEENFNDFKFAFSLDGNKPDPNKLASLDFPNQGQSCRIIVYQLTDWPGGEHHLSTQITFARNLSDGFADFEKGTFTYDYTVYVKP